MNEIFNVVKYRRSIRAFSDENIDVNLLKKIAEYSLYAPSVRNLQHWQLTILTNDQKLKRLSDIVKSELNRISYHKFYNAKALMIVSISKNSTYTELEAGAITQNIMLLAKSLGIGTCWIGQVSMLNDNISMKRMLDELGINSRYDVCSAVALGYPKEAKEEARVNKGLINIIN